MNDRDPRWGEHAKSPPVQFAPPPRAMDEMLQHLMLAVLADAVHCYQEHFRARDRRGQRLFDEAAGWLMAKDREYVFSFEGICDALGFDADYLRAGLRTWRSHELSAPRRVGRMRRRRTRTAERRRRIVASL
jgi:hypothetical protein